MKRSEVIAELEGMLIEYRSDLLMGADELADGIEVLKEAIRYLEESEKLGVDS